MNGDLPTGWVVTTLGDLCGVEYGMGLARKRRDATGAVGVFGSAGLVGRHSSALVEEPVIVVGRKGNAGSVWITDGPSWPIDTTYFLRPPKELSADFLALQLRSCDLVQKDSSTTIPSLRRPDLEATSILVAPAHEQKRIVAAIEEHFSRLDAADSALEMAKLRSAHLLECALQAGIRQYPTQESSLARFLTQKLSNGRSVPTANGDGFPVLRLTCLQGGLVNASETKLGDFSGVDHEKYRIEPDDFLISRGNGSIRLVGIGGLVPAHAPPVAFPDTLIRARVDRRRLRPEFLRLIWNSKIVRRQLEGQARTTAGIYKVNQTMIGKVSFPTPSPEYQDRLVQEMDQVREVVAGLDAGVSLAQGRSKSLRRSILADAFSGRLVPQDPYDEPASALLERISGARRTSSTKRSMAV